MNEISSLTDDKNIQQRIHEAQNELQRNRKSGLVQLNNIFREGTLPVNPLNGPTSGQMIAVDIAPLITPIARALLVSKMPWCGKVFDAASARGENIFYLGFKGVSRALFPFYADYQPEVPDRFRAFPFRTYSGPGLKDTDLQVLKIDYRMPVNPRLTIGRILDELVQVDDNYYFGKAYFKTWWGSWHLIFYFALQRV